MMYKVEKKRQYHELFIAFMVVQKQGKNRNFSDVRIYEPGQVIGEDFEAFKRLYAASDAIHTIFRWIVKNLASCDSVLSMLRSVLRDSGFDEEEIEKRVERVERS